MTKSYREYLVVESGCSIELAKKMTNASKEGWTANGPMVGTSSASGARIYARMLYKTVEVKA